MTARLASVVVLLATGLVVGTRSAAHAATLPGCGKTVLGSTIVCNGSGSTGTTGTTSSGGGGSGGGGTDPGDVVAELELQNGPEGGTCWTATYVSTAGLSHEIIASIEVNDAAIEANYPACPGVRAPRQPGASPVQLADAFWDTVRLPRPAPSSPPGRAITGIPAYLLAGDTDDPPPWSRATPFGVLVIRATGVFTVDWGDGSRPTGPYDTTGGTYPTGTITHVYEDTGVRTITVTETWSATWRIGSAYHGTLRRLRTTGELPGFRVGQVQAVVTG